MEQGFKKNNTLPVVNHFLYLFFFAGLIFSFRAISSISVGLLLLTGIITNKSFFASVFKRNPVNFFLAGCVLFFLLQFVSQIHALNPEEGWRLIRLKSGIVITPLAIYYTGYLNSKTAKKLFFDFSLLLAIACLYSLTVTFLHFMQSNDLSLFFYHQLVSPLKQHAVYFSIFVFISLVFLLESIRKKDFLVKRVNYTILIIFFSAFLLLLSSKLVIVFFIFYIIYYFSRTFSNKGLQLTVSRSLLILFMLSAGLILMTHNPISNRFSEILKGDITIVNQDQYKPADYFNGLQFRILQWKLVPEILNENKTWLAGVGGGDAQYYLNRKYMSKNLYIGDPQRKDNGFIGYNTHNQFLQALLENGITGVLVFIFICFSLLMMAWQKKMVLPAFIILLLLSYALIESVFETQYGIILFTSFPLLAYFTGSGQKIDK